MNKRAYSPLALLLIAVLTACGGGGTPADTTKPTVSLTSSSTNVTAAGNITLTATASDNVGVAKVEFFDGATKLGEDTTSPYTFNVALTAANNGTKSYTAKAFDAAGNNDTSTAVSVTVNIAVDNTAPTIVSTAPANNATGIAASENIIITFSEAMNQTATQGAYQSATAGIQPNQVAFSWNPAGTVLTIDPSANLTIAAGSDPAAVTAAQFAFQFTSAATDLSGNPLAPASVSFKTQRQITQNVPALGVILNDAVQADGNLFSSCSPICIGDTDANVQTKGFLSFNITAIPAGVQSFESANLAVNIIGFIGAPMTFLGGAGTSLLIEHVNAAALNKAAFDAAAIRQLGTVANTAFSGVKNVNVLVALQDDYTQRVARGNRTQYRVYFPTATNSNNSQDSAGVAFPTTAVDPTVLQVRYLLP